MGISAGVVRTAGPMRRALLPLLLVAVPASATAQALSTAAEASGFQRHTTHPEMMEYLTALRAAGHDMRLSSYGESREGRILPLAIFSRPLVGAPAEAALLGRPVVLLNGNVHGGERTLRESLLILMRDLATPGTPANQLLDELVILIAPQINPDGFHATARGQRGNAWGIDLNRDYIKLEHPEIAGYVGNVINTWHPHLIVDGHNGGSFPYNVNYQCPSHGSPDARITELCDADLFPHIDRAMQAHGFKAWYYTGGTATRWNTGGFQARIGRNYAGFANSIGVLFESPSGQELEVGVRSGLVAFRAVLDYVRANARRVIETVTTARRETIAMGQAATGEVVVDMRYGPEDRRVTYEVRAQAEEEGGERPLITVTSDSLMKRPIPLQTRARPFAYVLPRDAVAAVAMLRRHNIVVEVLEDSVSLEVQAYPIREVRHTSQYNHAAAVELEVSDPAPLRRTFPRGTYIVPTGQLLGRVVAHMLEPETDDNVIYWNTMDAWLPRPDANGADTDNDAGGQDDAALVPIFKLMTPRALPARVVQ